VYVVNEIHVMMRSDDYFVREYALSAVHKMHGLLSSTISELCDFIKNENEPALRSAAIRIFSEKKIVDASDYLFSQVESFDSLSRIATYETLGEICDMRHYSDFFQKYSCEKDSHVRSKIVVSLARLKMRFHEMKVPLEDLREFLGNPDPRIRASACLFWVDPGDENALMEYKKMLHDDSPRVVSAAAISVYNAREHRVVDLLDERISATEDPAARASYVFALRRMPDKKSSAIMLKLLSDPDVRVRRNAIVGLGALREKSAVKPLIELYFQEMDECRENLFKIISALKSIDNAETASTVYREINKVGNDNKHRATLVKFLSHFAWENMANNFKVYLQDEDPRVRANTIEAMMNLRERGIVSNEFVTKGVFLMTCDSNSRVVANAVRALYSCGTSGVVSVLREMLTSNFEQARKAAYYVKNFLPAGIMDVELQSA